MHLVIIIGCDISLTPKDTKEEGQGRRRSSSTGPSQRGPTGVIGLCINVCVYM
jgi:hypothetical protein